MLLKRKTVFSFLLALLGALLAALPSYATTLRIATNAPFDDLAPNMNRSDAYRYLVHKNVVQTLVDLNNKGEPIPMLAVKWEFNFDRNTVMFYLREGVKMHNGDVFNCDVASRSILRHTDSLINNGQRELAPVQRYIERSLCIGNYQLMLEFSEPYMFAVEDFASYQMGIYREINLGVRTRLVGTGPYMIGEFSRDELSLERNKDYWQSLARVEKIDIFYEQSSSEMANGLLEWGYDLVVPLTNGKVLQELIDNPRFQASTNDYKLYHGIGDHKWFVVFNQRKPILRNKDYRCGLIKSFNVNEINSEVFFGKAWPMHGTLGPYNRDYLNINQEVYEYSSEQAIFNISRVPLKERLNPVRLLIADDYYSQNIAEILQRDAQAVNALIEIDMVSAARFRKRMFVNKSFEIALMRAEDLQLFLHFYNNGKNGKELYANDDQDFYSTLAAALRYERGERVAHARYKSLIEFQGLSCQHAFLLQEPIFAASREQWSLPSFNLPTGGFRLDLIQRR